MKKSFTYYVFKSKACAGLHAGYLSVSGGDLIHLDMPWQVSYHLKSVDKARLLIYAKEWIFKLEDYDIVSYRATYEY